MEFFDHSLAEWSKHGGGRDLGGGQGAQRALETVAEGEPGSQSGEHCRAETREIRVLLGRARGK